MAYNHEDMNGPALGGSDDADRRLAELDAYQILDTEAERSFDDIVKVHGEDPAKWMEPLLRKVA